MLHLLIHVLLLKYLNRKEYQLIFLSILQKLFIYIYVCLCPLNFISWSWQNRFFRHMTIQKDGKYHKHCPTNELERQLEVE